MVLMMLCLQILKLDNQVQDRFKEEESMLEVDQSRIGLSLQVLIDS